MWVARVGRDHRLPHAQLLATEAVVALGVAAGVGQRGVERDEPGRLPHGRREDRASSWLGPTPGTAPAIGCEAVCTTAVGFGQARCRWPAPRAAQAEVGARVPGLEARRVHGGDRLRRPPGPPRGRARSTRPGRGGTPPLFSAGQQAGRGVRRRRVVGHPAQARRLAQLPPLGGERHRAAVVGPQELPQGQQGEELRLRVVVPRAAAAVRRGAASPAARASRATRKADFVMLRTVIARHQHTRSMSSAQADEGFQQGKALTALGLPEVVIWNLSLLSQIHLPQVQPRGVVPPENGGKPVRGRLSMLAAQRRKAEVAAFPASRAGANGGELPLARGWPGASD